MVLVAVEVSLVESKPPLAVGEHTRGVGINGVQNRYTHASLVLL